MSLEISSGVPSFSSSSCYVQPIAQSHTCSEEKLKFEPFSEDEKQQQRLLTLDLRYLRIEQAFGLVLTLRVPRLAVEGSSFFFISHIFHLT